jgi:acetyl/propionyl-CoA carboxylase alpha subunit
MPIGMGFLSENADFAEKAEQNNILLGPSQSHTHNGV